MLFIRDQDFTGCHLVPQFIIGQFITCFSGFKQSISEKSDTLAVFCYIVSSQHLIQIQAGIWLKACPAAELHSPPVQIMLLFQQQERLFLQERKIDGGNLFTEETEILNLGAGEAVSGQALIYIKMGLSLIHI